MRARVMLLGGCLLALGLAGPLTAQEKPRLYHYRDDHGREVLVTGKESVPSRYLERARPVGRGGGYGRLGVEPDGDEGLLKKRARNEPKKPNAAIYRFRTADGHVAYSDRPDDAPAGARVEPIDLTRPDALRGRGSLIIRELTLQEQQLAAAPACRQARIASETGWWVALARRHPALLAIGAVLLLLILVTPWMLRRVEAARWWRTLAFSVQILGMLGWATFAVGEARHSYRALKDMAEPCTIAAAGGETGAGMRSILRKLDRVQRLRTAMNELEGKRARVSEPGVRAR